MKIKIQFLISIIVFVIVASIIAASIVVTMQQTNRSNSQSQIAQDVQTRANNLVYVSGDYFLYQDSPDLSLWQTEYSAIYLDLSKLSATSSEQKTLLSNIEADAQRLNSSWSNVVSYLQNFPRNESVRVVPAFQDMWSAMSSQNQALIFDAQQLNQNFKTQVDQSNFINIILISALVVLFGAYFVINYLITYRNTLKSISDLQTGIATIGSGNLDYELKGGNNDEVSEISGSVNQMAANLKAVTASKSDLEKEIEERKKAEGEIRRLQDYLLLQVERMPIGLIVWGPDFRVQSWNPEATRIFGFTDEDAMGRHPYELIVPKEAQPVVDEVWGRLLKGDETANSINENITKDGRTIICDWSNTPLKKDDGTVLGVMSMIQDITDRKKAEEALVESEERWSTTLSSIGDAVIATDVEGKITFMNNVAQALTGYSLAEAAHKPLKQIFHIVNEETRREVEDPVSRVIKEGCVVGLANHTILARKDGSEVPIDDSGAPIKDKEGKTAGVVLIFRDITERKKAEEEVKESENRFHSLFSNMINGLAYCQMIFDSKDEPIDFVYLEINDAFERLTGLKRENVVGRKVSEAIPGTREANPEIFDIYGRVSKTGIPERFELFFKPLSIWLDIAVFSPKREYFVAVFENITERKKAEAALIESEQRWSTTLSSIGDAVIATDVSGKVVFMNSEAEELTGWALSEASQNPVKEVFNIVNEQTRLEVENPIERVLKEGMIVGLANHTILIRKDGSEVPIDDSGAPIKDQEGKITGVVLVFRDITDRKTTEAQLERQAELINLDPDAILARKPDGTITFWSCGAERLYGYTEEEALGQVSQRLLGTRFPADFELKDIIEQIKTTGAWSGELVQRTKDPREITVQSHWAIRVGENNEIEFLESNVDVTDRVQLQERLEDKAAEVEEYATRMEELVEERTNRVKRQASLIDLTPDAIMVRDFDGNISFWSAGAEKLYGWTAKEAVGQVSQDLLKTIFLDPVLDITARIEQAGSWTGELRQKTKDGREVVVESRWLAEKNQMGRIIDILESNVDITERKKAEVAVQSERQRLYDVLETMPAMVCLITPDYHIAFANLSFRERFGESKGRPCYEYCWGQSEPCKFCESLVPFTTGKPHNWEVTGPDGTVIEAHDYPFTDVDGKQLVLEMDIDITARKKAEAQAIESARKLKDAERLAAIGATAGMVGHDIRNPLQAITGDVYLAKSELDALPDSEEKKSILECLDETEKNIDYINKIVQDLQDYARPLNPKAEESDLRDVLEKMVSKNRLPSSIKVKIQVAEEARKISADSYYLNRILYNLFTNAVQAMPKGGKLTLKAERVAGETVITVQDTGVGIPKEIQPKLFTIMFTTKSKGQGFGLPVVKRMIESLGGTVTFESLEGKGTTFTVRLPVKSQ